jgi:hypothetical protein
MARFRSQIKIEVKVENDPSVEHARQLPFKGSSQELTGCL